MNRASKEKPPTDWKAELKSIAGLALAVVAIWSFVAKPFFIPSESMVPTLLVGDRLVVTKYPYGFSYLSPFIRILPRIEGRLFGKLPERGDIVVLKDPTFHNDWIKRVIGLPGDTVQMRGGTLYLNGRPVPKRPIAPTDIVESPNMRCDGQLSQFRTVEHGATYCAYPRFIETLPSGRQYEVLDLGRGEYDDTPPVRVPDGHVFVMGDNRDRSADSRVQPRAGGLGLLPIENISGRAEFLTFSLDGSLSLTDPSSWFGAFRSGRAGDSLRELPDDVAAEARDARRAD